MPVFPLVGSTMVPPGFRRPTFSAASIIATPIRSLTLPPGFMYSSFARTVAGMPSVTLFSLTRGVWPMVSRIVARTSTGTPPEGTHPTGTDLITLRGVGKGSRGTDPRPGFAGA